MKEPHETSVIFEKSASKNPEMRAATLKFFKISMIFKGVTKVKIFKFWPDRLPYGTLKGRIFKKF